MTGQPDIIQALRAGPMTNEQLRRATRSYPSIVAHAIEKLMRAGLVSRIDDRRSRTKPPLYALVQTLVKEEAHMTDSTKEMQESLRRIAGWAMGIKEDAERTLDRMRLAEVGSEPVADGPDDRFPGLG